MSCINAFKKIYRCKCGLKFPVTEKLLSIDFEESSSRDSGIPTTVLHDSLEVSNAHSPTASRTASSAATSRYYSDNIRFQSVIGQGRFSTVWKVNCVNEVSFLADNR